MKKWIVITICALCLSLFVPAALAEETAPDTDAIASATQQQRGRPSRGEMPQAPDQNNQETGRNKPDGQKHSRNGQMPMETAPAPQESMPEQDLQIPDSNGQQPDTGEQQKHAAKAGRGNRQKKQANTQTEELQSENSQPVFPEAPFPDDNPESASDWITRLEKMIDELNQMLESLNAKTVAE